MDVQSPERFQADDQAGVGLDEAPDDNHGVTCARAAVTLINYRDYGERFLADCYASLLAQTYPSGRFTVFVVNNGMTPESRACIERVAPRARVLNNLANLGWAGGNNTAIRVALAEGFDYLVMLNMDTVVEKGWLQRLVEAADARPDLHVLQSKLLLFGSGRVNSLGNRIQCLGYGYCNGYGDEDLPVRDHPVAVDYASGAAMLVKREVFQAIGLFRDDYFMYYDDMEFCWRARLAGFNVGVAEASICYHKYNFLNKMDLIYYLERNRLVTLLTLEKGRTLVVTGPCLIVGWLVMAAYFLVRGWGPTVWALVREFTSWRTWRSIFAQRRRIRALRVRKDAEIVRGFAGRIVFAEINHPVLRYVVNPLLALYWALARRLIVW